MASGGPQKALRTKSDCSAGIGCHQIDLDWSARTESQIYKLLALPDER